MEKYWGKLGSTTSLMWKTNEKVTYPPSQSTLAQMDDQLCAGQVFLGAILSEIADTLHYQDTRNQRISQIVCQCSVQGNLERGHCTIEYAHQTSFPKEATQQQSRWIGLI
jgi:hypothetical protein